MIHAVLYDATGRIVQRVSGSRGVVEATAAALALSYLVVPDDAAYEKTSRVQGGALVPLS